MCKWKHFNKSDSYLITTHEVTSCKKAHYELSKLLSNTNCFVFFNYRYVLDFVHTYKRQKAIRTHGLEASKCPIKHCFHFFPFLLRGRESFPTALTCQLHMNNNIMQYYNKNKIRTGTLFPTIVENG